MLVLLIAEFVTGSINESLVDPYTRHEARLTGVVKARVPMFQQFTLVTEEGFRLDSAGYLGL